MLKLAVFSRQKAGSGRQFAIGWIWTGMPMALELETGILGQYDFAYMHFMMQCCHNYDSIIQGYASVN